MDVIYQYDGTFAGFLCCIYDSYAYKESPVGFSSDEGFLSLYEVRTVPTSAAHSKRVYQGIFSRSAQAAKVLRRAFLTCMEDKELHLYAFACKALREGGGFMGDLSDPVYYPLHKALRHMSGELEKLRGFVRFSDYHGVLGAVIEPKTVFCRCCVTISVSVMPMRHFSSSIEPTARSCSTRRAAPASYRWSIWSWRRRMRRRSNTGGSGKPSLKRWPSRNGGIRAVRTRFSPSAIAAS